MIAQTRIADRYELKEPLGEGGMGIVYRALDIKTGRDVAIKTMRDVMDPLAIELFTKEWNVLAGLSHPNIVDLRDVGEIEDRGARKPFFVMPLLQGSTLAKLIETSSSRLTLERIVEIVTQVCRGLQVAHDNGLVHRDLKPSNIFVMDDDTAKIIDFGVVQLAESKSFAGHKGTWQYMAPEQAELKQTTPASDIFSLGVVCYEAFTGRKPFARRTPEETLSAISNYVPPPVSEINPRVPQLVSMVVHKAMAKGPSHRFSSARDFSDTLLKASRNEPIERFDRSRILPRIERARKAFRDGDEAFADDILNDLECEGHIDPEMTLLKSQIEESQKQRRIRQLLEGARTRLEQDEIPMALEKVREALEIDPENADAIALRATISAQRNQRQIQGWMDLARQHLVRHDFSEARQALKEVLAVQADDSDAHALLAEISVREREAIRIRLEKERFYSSALKAFQSGEISTALSKLERILSLARETPDAAVPERDAVYQSFYNQVRSERDSIHTAYEEGRRCLNEKNLAKALEICDQTLAKYPGDALFQALRLEIVETQRRDLSGFIADVGKRLEAEADLDRRVNILKEAAERYPNEQQFQQQLRLIRERRDLIQSITAKARHYEERKQFAEAIGQWDILRSIYPQYPGMEFEVEQLSKRREQQAREDEKIRLVERIDRALEGGTFAKALNLAVEALNEFPLDPELAGLERLAKQGLERSQESQRLMTEAKRHCSEGRYGEGIALLRQAASMDEKNAAIRGALVNALADEARSLVDRNWQQADALVEEAAKLDGAHPAIRGLRTLVAEAGRKEFVGQCLAEARDLQASADIAGALARVDAGLLAYPDDPRLSQLRAGLQSLIEEEERKLARDRDLKALQEIQREAGPNLLPAQWPPLLRRVRTLAETHRDHAPIATLAAEIEQAAGHFGPPSQPDPATQTLALTPSVPPPVQPVAAPTPPPPPVKPPAAWLREFWTATRGHLTLAAAWPANIQRRVPKLSPAQIGAAAGSLLLLAGAVAFVLLRRPSHPPPIAPAGVALKSVRIATTPADATVTVDGKIVANGAVPLPIDKTHMVSVSRLGFLPFSGNKLAAAQWQFALTPAPLAIGVLSAQPSDKLFLDDREIPGAQEGGLTSYPSGDSSGKHKLSVRTAPGVSLDFQVDLVPGLPPTVSALTSNDLIVVTSLGPDAVVYSADRTLRVALGGGDPQLIPADGLKLSGLSAQNHDLKFTGQAGSSEIPVDSGNAPQLLLGRNANSNLGSMHLTWDVDGAQLFLDGKPKKTTKKSFWLQLPPGDYKVKLTAPNYEDKEVSVKLVKGSNPSPDLAMTPIPRMASLVVEGGTPGAFFELNGKVIGQSDSNGSLKLDKVQPAKYTLSISKDGFDSKKINLEFIAGQTVSLKAEDTRLAELGRLVISVTPSTAKVEYREERNDPKAAGASANFKVKPGKYTVTAVADGYLPQSIETTVYPGKASAVNIGLQKLAAKPEVKQRGLGDLFEVPGQLVKRDTWFQAQKGEGLIWLKTSFPRVTLIFSNPGKNGIGIPRTVTWVVDDGRSQGKITYELSVRKLARKPENGKSAEHPFKPEWRDNLELTVELEPHRVVVTQHDGPVLDDYSDPSHPLAGARIAIKPGDAYFVVRVP